MKLLSALLLSTLVVYSSAWEDGPDYREDPNTYTCTKHHDDDGEPGWAAAALDRYYNTICMGKVSSGCAWFDTKNECEIYRNGLVFEMGYFDSFDCDSDYTKVFGKSSSTLGDDHWCN